MDRYLLTDHLAIASQHLADNERRLNRQRKILSDLVRNGHLAEALRAREELKIFEDEQAIRAADRDLFVELLRGATQRANGAAGIATV